MTHFRCMISTAQNFFMSENEVSERKFPFGPRIKMKPPQRKGSPLKELNVVDSKAHVENGYSDSGGIVSTSKSLKSAVNHSSNEDGPTDLNTLKRQVSVLTRERDEWKAKAETAIIQSELSLGDMLVEIEMETLREEVKRLTDLLAQRPSPTAPSAADICSLESRCTLLEGQVASLKKEKAQLEQKNAAARNADLNRIRALQEQVSHEKRMRERAVATESSLQVVSVNRTPTSSSSGNAMLVRPRSGSVPENAVFLPSFVVNGPSEPSSKPSIAKREAPLIPAAAVDVSKILDKTVILSNPRLTMSVGDVIGDDYIASQWKLLLSEKPPSWTNLLSRMPNTNIFCFGSLKVACKKIGNNIMIQLGRETMMLEKFIDTYGPDQVANLHPSSLPLSSAAQVPPLTKAPPVTMKSILAAKKN
jgi:hypothetical protein